MLLLMCENKNKEEKEFCIVNEILKVSGTRRVSEKTSSDIKFNLALKLQSIKHTSWIYCIDLLLSLLRVSKSDTDDLLS